LIAERRISRRHLGIAGTIALLGLLWWSGLRDADNPMAFVPARLLMCLGLIALLPTLLALRLEFAPVNAIGVRQCAATGAGGAIPDPIAAAGLTRQILPYLASKPATSPAARYFAWSIHWSRTGRPLKLPSLASIAAMSASFQPAIWA